MSRDHPNVEFHNFVHSESCSVGTKNNKVLLSMVTQRTRVHSKTFEVSEQANAT